MSAVLFVIQGGALRGTKSIKAGEQTAAESVGGEGADHYAMCLFPIVEVPSDVQPKGTINSKGRVRRYAVLV
jgi:hypothetical protein